MLPMEADRVRGGVAALLALLLAGCATPPREGIYGPRDDEPDAPFVRGEGVPPAHFEAQKQSAAQAYADDEDVESFSRQTLGAYRLGPGDRFAFYVYGREDVSLREVIVSPDGEVALPRAGILNVNGLTIDQATNAIEERLKRFYEEPHVTLVMSAYNNNKVYVLGRVANPGVVHLQGSGNLLEALALAGGLPVDTQRSWLSRCMIVRGRDMVIWIDLRDLLDNGNMALNARLSNGDVIYIPQSLDQNAYVMGEVLSPGILQLRSRMSVLDAIMVRGGLTRNAMRTHVFLVRRHQGKGLVERIDVSAMYEKGDYRQNYVLQDGDIVYVPVTGMGKLEYFMGQILPTLEVLDFGLDAAERVGAMYELRRKLWNQ